MRDRGRMTLMEGALSNRRSLLSRVREESVERVNDTPAVALYVVDETLTKTTKPPSCPGENKRLLLIRHLPSFVPFSNGLWPLSTFLPLPSQTSLLPPLRQVTYLSL